MVLSADGEVTGHSTSEVVTVLSSLASALTWVASRTGGMGESVCLSVRPSLCLSVLMSVFSSAFLFVRLSVRQCVRLSVPSSFHPCRNKTIGFSVLETAVLQNGLASYMTFF